ncbi:MAG: hypothetical protein M0T70_09155 [Geobacteraceae bacterium]|nr:hypothetical protein [Geobacteraceae bacterium]
MSDKSNIIANVKKWARHAGKNDYLNYLGGARITRNQAIKAKCYECVQGEDTSTCTIFKCPLTPFSPWNKKGHSTT